MYLCTYRNGMHLIGDFSEKIKYQEFYLIITNLTAKKYFLTHYTSIPNCLSYFRTVYLPSHVARIIVVYLLDNALSLF